MVPEWDPKLEPSGLKWRGRGGGGGGEGVRGGGVRGRRGGGGLGWGSGFPTTLSEQSTFYPLPRLKATATCWDSPGKNIGVELPSPPV